MKHRTHKKNWNLSRRERGFTLVELLVAVGIFSIVMLIAMGAVFSVVGVNRRVQAQQAVMNNLNAALDSMVREIRVGTTFHCSSSGSLDTPRNCSGGSTLFAFEASNGNPAIANDQIVYRQNGTAIERSSDGGSSYTPLTSPEVVIEDLSFTVAGSGTGDNRQPRVLIIMRGHAGIDVRSERDFDLQTLISQRLLQIE